MITYRGTIDSRWFGEHYEDGACYIVIYRGVEPDSVSTSILIIY
jgi:hypothetical protein